MPGFFVPLLTVANLVQAEVPLPAAAPAAGSRVVAVRAVLPPLIDGRDDDPVWLQTRAITEFREWQPADDGDPRFPTVAKIAYDAGNLYIFVRAFDPHPDSILKPLSRRDQFGPSDRVGVMFDSYHDRRTGYEFWVTPAGVKVDVAIYNDGNEDDAWDAVWDVATRVDSVGWTAEFRIPLSQLRYAKAATHTFGVLLMRDIYRYTERLAWPLVSRSRAGIVSQFGELTGLDGLGSPRRGEVTPYTVAKNVSVPTATGYGRDQSFTAGADVKYGVTSNLTLNGTVNPDFGQVEADPAVLNLTAFETFFQERRPFFVEGTGIFRFPVDCNQVNCSGEGLFYSRRIGRAPQLGDDYYDPRSPTATRILGAGKLTGRLAGGLSVGALEAFTQRVAAPGGATIEPRTNYSVVRLQQDLDSGETGVGLLFTGVNRGLDGWSDALLRRTAYVGAVDARRRFAHGRYEVSGSLDFSRVAGTAAAIAATQRDAVHYYQRPDAGLPYDTTRTSLTGDAEELRFAKVGGRRTNFETTYQRRSPGFEVNDLGFLRRADQQNWSNWFGLRWNQPSRWYRQANWNFNWWQQWSARGLPGERALNSNTHLQFNNRWWLHAGATLGQLGTNYCDRCMRGGPALRVDRYVAPWFGFESDDRRVVAPFLFFNYWRGDGGRSHSFNANGSVMIRASARVQPSVGFDYSVNRYDSQWFGNFPDALDSTQLHYTVARLYQRTLGLTARADYTLRTTLTLQVYIQPFVSKGTYANVRELANPRAATYGGRFQPYTGPQAAAPGGFNYKQFNSNVVLRWEYRPGSTLFVVWTQGRALGTGAEGTRSFAGDLRDLFDLHPDNTFLVKMSYWLSW